MTNGRGRPPKDVNKKTNKVTVRLSNEKLRQLVYVEDKLECTRSGALEKAISHMYNLTKNVDYLSDKKQVFWSNVSFGKWAEPGYLD